MPDYSAEARRRKLLREKGRAGPSLLKIGLGALFVGVLLLSGGAVMLSTSTASDADTPPPPRSTLNNAAVADKATAAAPPQAVIPVAGVAAAADKPAPASPRRTAAAAATPEGVTVTFYNGPDCGASKNGGKGSGDPCMCKSGGSEDGGVAVGPDGLCQAWCSSGGFCGNGREYESGGTDCHNAVPVASGGKGAAPSVETVELKWDPNGGDSASVESGSFCVNKFPSGAIVGPRNDGERRSIRLTGRGEIDIYEDCNGPQRYWSTVMAGDGCVNLYTWPKWGHFRIRGSSLAEPARQPHEVETPGTPLTPASHMRIVYSGESSNYMGYQASANYYAFLTTGQTNAQWTRLLTAGEPDDLAERFPTFTAKRHPYSRRYGPTNKADVLAKWALSPSWPTEDVIVVLDPDNWLLKDISVVAKKVSKGHAVAEAAWFSGSRSTVTRLWRDFCLQNCDARLDLAAVPYFVHRDDMATIAPLWRMYTLMIKERGEHDKAYERRFGGIQLSWCAEMYGYVFAAAHAGVKHDIVSGLQVRDVDGPPSSSMQAMPGKTMMLHVGRAWMPKSYAPSMQWYNPEGRPYEYRGNQVWCKCNTTGADIHPWPIPDNLDFQSKHTLRILHESKERFGKIEGHAKYRPFGNYHAPFP